MAKLLISTQYQENYGAHDWDGEGQCPQYWKFKGGSEYVIENFKGGQAEATMAIMAVRNDIEVSNDYVREQIVGWDIVPNNHLTDFERSQLEYEGRITYPAKVLKLEEEPVYFGA